MEEGGITAPDRFGRHLLRDRITVDQLSIKHQAATGYARRMRPRGGNRGIVGPRVEEVYVVDFVVVVVVELGEVYAVQFLGHLARFDDHLAYVAVVSLAGLGLPSVISHGFRQREGAYDDEFRAEFPAGVVDQELPRAACAAEARIVLAVEHPVVLFIGVGCVKRPLFRFHEQDEPFGVPLPDHLVDGRFPGDGGACLPDAEEK